MNKPFSEPSSQEMLQFLEGQVTEARAIEVRSHLPTCPICQRNQRRWLDLMQGLYEVNEEVVQTDLLEGIKRKIQHPASCDANKKAGWIRRQLGWSLPSIAVACAIVVVLWIGFWQKPSENLNEVFQAKSSKITNDLDRWCGISVYRLDSIQHPTPITKTISRNDELLFAYTNLGPSPFEYIMIFGVDSQGQLFWFYPAYESDETDPGAVSIEKRTHEAELNEKIQHSFSPGKLKIIGLFTYDKKTVSQIEASVNQLIRGGSWFQKDFRVPIEGSGQHVITLEVTP